MDNLRSAVLSILEGDFEWNGVDTSLILPVTKLDLSCILSVNYYDVEKVVNDLIFESVVFKVNNKIYLKLS
ncbi:hypothetical protein [Vibrio harveyi]|uniref:hypothetical protein n=1 Tax=Vibrio harveyi TaxID=669 RepID=UPI000C7B0286|nr:hypothetical protein [Vibrio harveyi]